MIPRTPAGLERQDLAYALWKDSPLARHHSLSALVVQRENVAAVVLLLRHAADRSGDWSTPTPPGWEDLSLPLWAGAS